jgi:hypothetical protein
MLVSAESFQRIRWELKLNLSFCDKSSLRLHLKMDWLKDQELTQRSTLKRHKNLEYQNLVTKLIFILLAINSKARICYLFCRIPSFLYFEQSVSWFSHSSISNSPTRPVIHTRLKLDWFTTTEENLKSYKPLSFWLKLKVAFFLRKIY